MHSLRRGSRETDSFNSLLSEYRALRRTVDVVRDVLDRTTPGRAVADFGAELDACEPEIFRGSRDVTAAKEPIEERLDVHGSAEAALRATGCLELEEAPSRSFG